MTLLAGLKIEIEPDEPLAKHTSWKIGGDALFMAWPKTVEDLLGVLTYAHDSELPYYVLGRGSNVLFSDEGFPGLVINLLEFEKDYLKIEENLVEVSCGTLNSVLIQGCADRDLGGMEFLSSIPGSVGGAVVQNAGFSRLRGFKNEIGHFVEEVSLADSSGKMRVLHSGELKFGYRDSNLRSYILLRAKLRFEHKPKKEVQEEIYANYRYRSEVQDLQHPSAGSVFKNPLGSRFSAGEMIDKAGLRGYRIGDAQISPRHANFFINLGRATSQDMRALIQLAKDKVQRQFGVSLEEEIRYVSA